MFYVARARCWYRAAGDCSGRARRGDAGRTNWLQHNLSTTPDGETTDVPVQDMAQTGYNTTSPLLQMGRLLMYRQYKAEPTEWIVSLDLTLLDNNKTVTPFQYILLLLLW